LEVQEEERRRIDQEIHDEMGGLLTSLQFTVDMARRTTPEGTSTDHFDQLETFVSDLSTVSRTISRKLYPSDLSQHGLDEALRSLVNEMERNRDLVVDLYSEIGPEDRFSVLIERTVYWIVQESLLSIARRDDTETTNVIVSQRGKRLYVHVFDEGGGLTSSSLGGDGNFRLKAIRRRTEWLDGDVRIDSIPNEGIRLSVTLPVELPFPPR
jgi:signal transduction histidine kinase